MSGEAKSKIELDVKAYIHLKDPDTNSRTVHLDIEGKVLNDIIKPGEKTFAAGKEGGFFLGLKKEMQERIMDMDDVKKAKNELEG